MKYCVAANMAGSPTTPVPLSGDFCEQMRKAHEMGYDAIEIHVPDVSVLDIPAIRACMRETGMEVATLGTGTIYGRYGLHLCDADEQKIEPSTAKMKVNPSIARFFNVESPNAKIALEQGWLTANDPRIMYFFSEYEAVVSAYEQAVREGKEHPSEEQEQAIQQRKQKMERTQMLMQLKPLVLPMDFDYDIETDGDYDPEDYDPVFAEMLKEKRKRQRNPEEKTRRVRCEI